MPKITFRFNQDHNKPHKIKDFDAFVKYLSSFPEPKVKNLKVRKKGNVTHISGVYVFRFPA